MAIKVLLVDDETELTENLAERLQTRGFEVATAPDGSQALLHVEQHEVDVVVLDLQMPGMDGVETLRELKKVRPATEVVMLTGHGTIEKAAEGKRVGAADYLIKPCDIVLLATIIRSLYEKRTAGQDGGEA